GSWFSYEGNKLGQGRDAVKTLLLDNPELMDEIELKIKEKAGLIKEQAKKKEPKEPKAAS
ncbi:MAG: DNA recombination/repair protein RecA, partial [Cyclobacteriaceae bacterium]